MGQLSTYVEVEGEAHAVREGDTLARAEFEHGVASPVVE